MVFVATEEKKRLNIKLDPMLAEAFKNACAQARRSQQAMVVKFIKRFVKKQAAQQDPEE